MAFVTEERSVFKGMTLRDNLRIGGVDSRRCGRAVPGAGKRMSVRGGLLSGGEQQMLTLARALGRKPRLLLADELSLGLAPLVVDRLLKAVRRAADEHGTAVIMVEQHAHKALSYTDHAIVMRRGRVGLDLTGEDARTRIDDVEQAYLTSSDGNGSAGDRAGGAAEQQRRLIPSRRWREGLGVSRARWVFRTLSAASLDDEAGEKLAPLCARDPQPLHSGRHEFRPGPSRSIPP